MYRKFFTKYGASYISLSESISLRKYRHINILSYLLLMCMLNTSVRSEDRSLHLLIFYKSKNISTLAGLPITLTYRINSNIIPFILAFQYMLINLA